MLTGLTVLLAKCLSVEVTFATKYLPDENFCDFLTSGKVFLEQLQKVHISNWNF